MQAFGAGGGNPLSALLGDQADLGSMIKFAGLLQKAGAEADPRCDLLLALKPFLRKERKARVDEAAKILKLLRLAQALRGGF